MKPPVLEEPPSKPPNPQAHPHMPRPSAKRRSFQKRRCCRHWTERDNHEFVEAAPCKKKTKKETFSVFFVRFLSMSASPLPEALHWKKQQQLWCAHNSPPTHSPHLSLSYSKLFDTFFLLYSLLGWYSPPQHPPYSLSLDLEDHLGVPPPHPPTKHLFFLDCTKEDGGISSCLLTKLVQKTSSYHFLLLNAFILYPCFDFLVYILVISFFLNVFLYSGIYENKLWTQESHFFLL